MDSSDECDRTEVIRKSHEKDDEENPRVTGEKWMHCNDEKITEIQSSFLDEKEIHKAVYGFAYEKISCPDICAPEDPDQLGAEQTLDRKTYSNDSEHQREVQGLAQSLEECLNVEPEYISNPQENIDKQDSVHSNMIGITLEEDEVPGARLEPSRPLKTFTKDVLKRWLQCRGFQIKGLQNLKKQDLISLVEKEIKKQTAVDCHIDGGSWLRAKMLKMSHANDEKYMNSDKGMNDVEGDVVRAESTTIVDLTEDGVDGAKLPNKPFQQIRVAEMKTYLALRGQPVTGSKSDLWERIGLLRESGQSHILHTGDCNEFHYRRKQEALMSNAGLKTYS